jgi:tetratricopeptide (TPR) repeat protein
MSTMASITPIDTDPMLQLSEAEAAVRLDDAGAHERVAELLDQAAQLVRSDPGKGRQLAELCLALAFQLQASDIVPGAYYICARACAVNAEYDTAIRLIAEARAGYLAVGARLEAMRTNVGLMHVLREQGRYDDALRVGQETLADIATPEVQAHPDEAAYLAALIEQNMGLCYEQTGRYEAALDTYADAERRYRDLGMAEQIGEIGNNRGIVLLALGQPMEALAHFEQSAAIFAQAGLTLLHATTLINIGNAHVLLGRFARGLAAFECARRLFATLDAQADADVLTLDTGDAYMALNRYPEALAVYREASIRLRDAGMPHDQARALWGAGTALLAQSQLEAAAQALDQAAGLFRATGNLALLSGVLLEHAALLAQRHDTAGARSLAAQALTLVAGQDLPVQQFYAHLRLADLHHQDLSAAERHLLAARRIAAQIPLPHFIFRLHQRLGHLRLRQGRAAEARELLLSAIDLIERLRGGLATESLRVSFLQDKVAVYEDMLRLQLDDEEKSGADGWEAFGIAERAKARTLADLLAGDGDRAALDGAPAEILAALQANLHAAYTELLGHNAPRAPGRAAALWARAADIEQAIAVQQLRGVVGVAPDPLATPLSSAQLRQHVRNHDGLLAYHIVGDEVLAFVYVGGKLHIERRVSQVSALEPLIARLASQWERFGAGPAFVERHLTQLTRSTQQALGEIYQELIAPLAGLLASIRGSPRRLAIVPHGLLHQIPFHALFDGGRYLIDDYEIVYAPSTTALVRCATRLPQSSRALIVGVDDPLIPMVAQEVAAIGRHLPRARLLTAEAATVRAVREQARACAVLHLACHGLFRSDNPSFSSLRLGDGWLTAAEIAQLDLRGALVALSACDSGRGRVYDGDEVIGLARAFLVAGARTLLCSLWLVQDVSTAALMERWYAELASGHGPAAALRQAQLAVREQFRHPYYWAPFFVVGSADPPFVASE